MTKNTTDRTKMCISITNNDKKKLTLLASKHETSLSGLLSMWIKEKYETEMNGGEK